MLILYIVSTLIIFLSTVSFYIYSSQKVQLMDNAQKNAELEVNLIGNFITDSLLRADYIEARDFLQTWTTQMSVIERLDVIYENGRIFFEFERSNSPTFIEARKTFNYGGRKYDICVKYSSHMIEQQLYKLKIVLIALMIFMTFVFSLFLWLTLSRWILKPLSDEIEYQTREIKEYSEKLEKLSTTDQLTNLCNRRKINEVLEYELNRANRYSSPLSVAMIDMDFFKDVNDTYGHKVGDRVLEAFATVLESISRSTDIASRWGGEEFLVLLPNTTPDEAFAFAEKVRKEVEETEFPEAGFRTCSIGVSTLKERDSAESLVDRADKALYKAKDEGRNLVAQL